MENRWCDKLHHIHMVTGMESSPQNSAIERRRSVTLSRANIKLQMQSWTAVVVHDPEVGVNAKN